MECEGSLPHIPSHFLTLSKVCDVTFGLLLGPYPCDLFASTLGLLLGPQPCNPFALVASPKLGLRHSYYPRASSLFFKKKICNVKNLDMFVSDTKLGVETHVGQLFNCYKIIYNLLMKIYMLLKREFFAHFSFHFLFFLTSLLFFHHFATTSH